MIETQTAVSIVSLVGEGSPLDPMDPLFEAETNCVIIEGTRVLDAIESLPEAFCLTFGLLYALHLDYPKKMRNTFEFVQKVMLNLGGESLRPKVQTFKNKLLD